MKFIHAISPAILACCLGSHGITAEYSGNFAYEVQTSPDLGTWTNVDPMPVPSGGSLSYTLPPGLGKQFVRLRVAPTL